MATVHPPPAPPMPPTCGNKPVRIPSPPRPGHAALPYCSPPVQETSPSPEAVNGAEGAPAPPLLPVQNGPQCPLSAGKEDNPSDSEEKHHPGPVQETDPAPQMTEQQDVAAVQMDQAGEDQLS